jgi:hypothetical protein
MTMETQQLDGIIVNSILANVSSAIAIFDSLDQKMIWNNAFFKRLTWFGNAPGGKSATDVSLWDFFDDRDFDVVKDLLAIGIEYGRSYDFMRRVRRGTNGFFPAELYFYTVGTSASGAPLVCLEVVDISLYKSYDEVEGARV